MAFVKDCTDFVDSVRVALFDEDSREIIIVLMKLVSNLIKFPDDMKYRVVRRSNKTMERLLFIFPKTLDYLLLIGFTEEDGVLTLHPDKENRSQVESSLVILKRFATEIGVNPKSIPAIKKYAETTKTEPVAQPAARKSQEFNPFASNVLSLNAHPQRGNANEATEMRIAQIKMERMNLMQDAGIPKREIQVFTSLKGAKASKQVADDEIDDGAGSNLAAAAGKALIEKNEKSKQFSTKAMRDLAAIEKESVYVKTLIRVQLPNRWIVEVYFSPLESFSTLGDILVDEVFQKAAFESLGEEMHFYLTPPKQIIPSSNYTKSFAELKLVPAVVVHLGWGKHVDGKKKNVVKMNNPSAKIDYKALIKPELISDATEKTSIPKAVISPKDKPAAPQAKRNTKPNNSNKSTKKPKWFKL